MILRDKTCALYPLYNNPGRYLYFLKRLSHETPKSRYFILNVKKNRSGFNTRTAE